VCIQAVLIPADVGRRIFGKEVADHYAVVELIICNEDTKASLIVQSIFLDYSEWLLSGNGLAAEHPLQLSPNETATKKSQVASVESRLVRGELLDAQQWTARNWTMRILTALGSVAVGFAFPFSTDVNKGFSAFNGVVIPAAQNLWPDGTIPQVNRISDVGFQTNKVIGPKHADVVVAFFPVNRFLTKGFQKEFLRNTAAWFVPKEMVADPKTVKEFEMFAGPLARQIDTKLTPANFQGAMLNAMLARCKGVDRNKGDEPAHQCRLQDLLDGVSLNRIHVVLHGIMTVDEQTIPASIQSVEFKAGRDPSIWTKTGADQAGFVKGMYLTGGTVFLVDANGDSIDGVTTATVAEGSTDERLNFTMKFPNAFRRAPKFSSL
jgi:hypothetical protein